MFNEERGIIPSSDIIRFLCEDTLLANCTKILIKESYNVSVVPLNRQTSYSEYPLNLNNSTDHGKNKLVLTANQTLNDERIYYILDRDYQLNTECNILQIDYYSIENYLLHVFDKLKLLEVNNDIDKIKSLFSMPVRQDKVCYDLETDSYVFKGDIHEQYLSYIDKNITCKNSFLQYLKIDKTVYRRLTKSLDVDSKKMFENLNKLNQDYTDKFREMFESKKSLDITFFDSPSKTKLKRIGNLDCFIIWR